jgi:Uri superfamily endonuclease
MKGVYAIILDIQDLYSLKINKKEFQIKKGIYIYVGSALGLGGISKRIERYFQIFNGIKRNKHWHIDYLIPKAKRIIAIYAETNENYECRLFQALKNMEIENIEIVRGFGNTDCRAKCGSHLLYVGRIEIENIIEKVMEIFRRIDLKPLIMN